MNHPSEKIEDDIAIIQKIADNIVLMAEIEQRNGFNNSFIATALSMNLDSLKESYGVKEFIVPGGLGNLIP